MKLGSEFHACCNLAGSNRRKGGKPASGQSSNSTNCCTEQCSNRGTHGSFFVIVLPINLS